MNVTDWMEPIAIQHICGGETTETGEDRKTVCVSVSVRQVGSIQRAPLGNERKKERKKKRVKYPQTMILGHLMRTYVCMYITLHYITVVCQKTCAEKKQGKRNASLIQQVPR